MVLDSLTVCSEGAGHPGEEKRGMNMERIVSNEKERMDEGE